MDGVEKYDSISGGSTPTGGEQPSMRVFTGWILVSQLLGLLAVILVAVWMGHYEGGFAWQDNPKLEFNYHPLFMVIGMVFLYGDAILVYRVFRNEKKLTVKILHATLHAFVLIFSGVGLKAVFDSHNLPEKPIANLYSLHSWLGIATLGLFALQWLVGLFSFLVPGLPMRLRVIFKPYHVFWGLGVFFLAVATCLVGINEKEGFDKEYPDKPPEGILGNCLGLVLVALAFTIAYILTNPNYERPQLPDEERIQLTE